MTLDTSFDDLDSPAKPVRLWNPKGETPAKWRDYRLVLADARPVFVVEKQQYCWRDSGIDWWYVDPPNGIIPATLFTDMVFLMRFTAFETVQGAMAALEVVILRRERNLTENDG